MEESHLGLIRSRAKIIKKGRTSIPRLELAAIIIGVGIYESITQIDPKLKNSEVIFWTDSMASLRWVQGVKQWPPFIENRVSIIRKLNLTIFFHYICSEANPADLLTRGLEFCKLEKSNLWWKGPNPRFLDLSDFNTSPNFFKFFSIITLN